jgi:hypothetical protein
MAKKRRQQINKTAPSNRKPELSYWIIFTHRLAGYGYIVSSGTSKL